MPWDNRVQKNEAIKSSKEAYSYESPFPEYDNIVKNPTLIEKFSFKGKDTLNLGIKELDLIFIDTLFNKYIDEWNPSNKSEDVVFTKNSKFNLSYPEFDAFVLYCYIRHYQPKNMIEIGSGQSTRVIVQALLKNNNNCKLTCIEPYTNIEYLKKIYPVNTIKDMVENVDINLFTTLGENDILFIDSSHVLKPFGDVEYEYLHILPILNDGCIVHIHDIFYPHDYPRVWIFDWRCVLTEQQILIAFLYGNKYWKLLCANHYLTTTKKEIIPQKIEVRCGGSFWIKKIKY